MMDTFTFDTADVKYTVSKNVEHLHVLKRFYCLNATVILDYLFPSPSSFTKWFLS